MSETRLNVCAYCKRRNVPAAESTSEIVFKDPTKPLIIFTSSSMCTDCARMLAHGAGRGMAAFYEEIQRLRKGVSIAPQPISWDSITKEVDKFLRRLDLES